jgi:hypothetical protein
VNAFDFSSATARSESAHALWPEAQPARVEHSSHECALTIGMAKNLGMAIRPNSFLRQPHELHIYGQLHFAPFTNRELSFLDVKTLTVKILYVF